MKKDRRARRNIDVISEVKQWVSGEISEICLNTQEDENQENKMLFEVEEDHPLYPLLEMINHHSKGIDCK